MTTITTTPRHARRSLLINRNYGLLWTGRTLSILGDFTCNASLVVWISLIPARRASWAPLAVSGLLICGALPSLLAGPVAGVFADRWNKRRAMLVMDAVRVVLLVVMLLVTLHRPPQTWLLAMTFTLVVLLATCDQFFRLSAVSLIPAIVGEDEQPQAMGWGQASLSLAMILGPPIAAPLTLGLGVQWALAIDALSFVISFATTWAIQVPGSPGRSEAISTGFRRDISEGIRFLAGSRVLCTIALTSVIAMLGGSGLNTLDVFFVTHNLHTPGSWYGLLDSVFGVGAILGAILASAFAERLGLGRTLSCSVLTLGLAVMVYSRLTAFAPAAVLLFACGIPMAGLQVAAGSLIMRVTPASMVARVSSVMDTLTVASLLIGSGVAGYLDGVMLRRFHATVLGWQLGPVDTIFLGAGVIVLIAGCYALLHLRGTERRKTGRGTVAEEALSARPL